MEIERKFLLTQLPEIVSFEVASIEQAYISIDPEVRIRKKTILKGKDKGKTDYKLTVKSSGTLAREEFETSVTKEFYENTLAFIGKPPITKFYEKYYDGTGLILECSIVDHNLPSHFIYGEVEFESADDAKQFVWPDPSAKDVTEDPYFKMKNYWKRTRPTE